MLTVYGRYLLATYLANAASGLRRRDKESEALADRTADRERRIALPPVLRRRRRHWPPDDDTRSKEQFRNLRQELQGVRPARAPRRDRTSGRIERLSQTADLSRTDAAIVELLLRYRTHPDFESMIDDVFINPSRWPHLDIRGGALPLMLGLSPPTGCAATPRLSEPGSFRSRRTAK